MSSVTATITAKWNGGKRPGPPTFGVLHDAETPLEAGYAKAIANMFATTTAQKSATYMVDPVDTVQLLDESLIAWHVGNANPRSIGVEQAGYAAFTLAQWSTPAAFLQEARVAQLMREIQGRHGIGLYWMTDQQLRDAHAGRIVGGWATHDQCTRVIGGSTHTDPAPNYPLARLMAAANGTSQEDDMTPEQATTLDQIAWLVNQIKPQTDRLTAVQDATDKLTWGVLDESQGLRVMVAGLLGKEASGVTAADVAALIPDGIAKDVADELQRRLAA